MSDTLATILSLCIVPIHIGSMQLPRRIGNFLKAE